MKNSKGCDNEKCGDYLKFNGSNPNKEGVIVNGVDWTNQTNTLQDWHYKISGYIDINFFISCTRKPNASKLFDYWKENRRSFINYMKQVHKGVKGVLIDEKTKKFIRNDMIIEIDNKKPVIVNSQGDYYRLLLPGTYNLTISIEEYIDSNWYQLDKATDEDAILTQLETEHERSINEIVKKDNGQPSANQEQYEEEEEDANDDESEAIESDDDDEEMMEEGDQEPWVPPSPVFNSS